MDRAVPAGRQRESRLLGTFVEVAATLVDDYDVSEVLHRLAGHCVELLDASTAGILLADQRGNLQVLASSTEQTRRLELFQLQADEGPCLEAFRTGATLTVADLAGATQRWPTFVPHAREAGVAAVHAVPLRLRQETIGTLNLFNQHPGTLGEADAQVAQALADFATTGILQERAIRRGEVLTEQLQAALDSRIAVEQAKGVLAQAGNLDMDQAFHALRAYARDHNARLHEVAQRLAGARLDPRDVLNRRRAGG
ncbi:GAF domain-containing protein [Lipingzhangella halophila]|uniref:GAF domain-containing protein n=1 Tax=Lipingzhangella halophila TaxID=1783352 RepID=A0A7W7RLU3_9ACTN|nr:GAF and ANTAR domain-containing protein [Lipingzhangella halophila]MBB4934367.1 GAF domain-containing protein [Lipingzhangella halophila]